MKYYSYHPTYFYYIGENECYMDPIDGSELYPGDSTLIEPPNNSDPSKVVVFDVENQQWDIVEDQRGVWYDISNLMEREHTDPRNKPINATRKKPPINFIEDLIYNEENDEWIINVHYEPENYPKSNIFPELLPSSNINFEPVYSEELGRWTYVSTDSPTMVESTGLFSNSESSEYSSILERMEILSVNIQELSNILGITTT